MEDWISLETCFWMENWNPQKVWKSIFGHFQSLGSFSVCGLFFDSGLFFSDRKRADKTLSPKSQAPPLSLQWALLGSMGTVGSFSVCRTLGGCLNYRLSQKIGNSLSRQLQVIETKVFFSLQNDPIEFPPILITTMPLMKLRIQPSQRIRIP